jgi:hypothetical protein
VKYIRGLQTNTVEPITGDTIDISEWVDFKFYDLIKYWDTRDDDDKASVGRWLGVSHHVGSALCYWILTNTGKVLARTTVQHFTASEVREPEVQKTIQVYHSELESNIGSDQYDTSPTIDDFINDDIDAIRSDDETEDDDNYYGLPPSLEIDDVVDNSDARLANDSYDKYVGAELSLPDRKGSNLMAKVMKKVINADRNKGNNYNPMIDESVYEVTFSDGTTEELAANVIAENMYSNVDSEGHHYQL